MDSQQGFISEEARRAAGQAGSDTPAPREQEILLLPRKEFDKLGDGYVRLSDVLTILRVQAADQTPRASSEAALHWPEIYHTANGYKVQCDCGWASPSFKGCDPDERLRAEWKEHVALAAQTTPPPSEEHPNE